MVYYLDNCATTKPLPEAVAACLSAMENHYGNPSSLHGMGLEAERLVRSAQTALAAATLTKPGEWLFTSGATEANNLAILGTAAALHRQGRRIVTTAIEHPSVLEPLWLLESQGWDIVRLKPENGGYTPMQFAEAVDEKTVLCTCMQVNNETGLILPVEEIAAAVKRKNPQTRVHVDGVQGFLRQNIRLSRLPIDLYTVSGHKVCAPKGVGALYRKTGVRLVPQLLGGGQQEGIRSGTESVPLIAAFGAAVTALQGKMAEQTAHLHRLKTETCQLLSEIEGIVLTPSGPTADWVCSFSAPGYRSEVLLHALERKGIYLSSGSACKKGKQSHVLEAMGIDRKTADGTLRVSFCHDTPADAPRVLCEALRQCLATVAHR